MQASDVAIREKVGYLAQELRYYDHLTARETLRFTAHFFYKGPSRALEKHIEETLELVVATVLIDGNAARRTINVAY